MPRVVLAALVGGMLSLAGATYQGVFRNPLVDPYLLGVAAGAGLGATLAIAYLPDGLRGQQALPAAAFVGGSVAVFLTYSVGRSASRGRDTTTLVLAGVTVASFFTALQTFVQQQNADTLQQVYTWILGSIPSSGWSDVVLVLPYVAIATVVILVYRRVVDVLSLGDDEAASLGVDVRRVRLTLVVAATVGTAAAVAVCGLIGFVGIIVPHAIRMLAGVGLPGAAPALRHRRRRIPRACGRHRPDRARSRRDPAGHRHGLLRSPLLRSRAADEPGNRMSAIELTDVTVVLGGRPVVDQVDLTFDEGEWIALIGPNGAGKTTLLRAIARLVPFSGSIELEGRSTAAMRRSELSRLIAVVPQDPSTPPWMTVGEYVLLGRTPHLGRSRRRGGAIWRRRREPSIASTSPVSTNGRSAPCPEARSSASSLRVHWRRRRGSSSSTSRPQPSTSATSSRRSTCSTCFGASPG